MGQLPTAFKGGVTIDGVPIAGGGILSAGKVLWLDGSRGVNNASTSGTAAKPFDTGAFALTQARANKGDVIIADVGHDETLATLLALTTKANVTFIDLRYSVTWTTKSTGIVGVSMPVSVAKPTANLPATTNLNIFTVVGHVRVTDLWGIVTTVIQTQACNTKLQGVATGLTAVDVCAVLDITAAAVGTIFSITGTFANAMVASANQTRIFQAGAVDFGPGVIRVNTAATNTGQVQWNCTYVPLTPDAYVVAA